MLVHKVDGENPVTYSELLLTVQKLERWAEVRNPLLPKIPTTRSLNVTHSHSQGNVFPSRKLKGNHTFAIQSMAVVDYKTEEIVGLKPNGGKEAESSAGEEVWMTGEVGNVGPSFGYICGLSMW